MPTIALRSISVRSVNAAFSPSEESLAGLAAFDEGLPAHSRDPAEVLTLLDERGSSAAVATNDRRYFGFVTGAALPASVAAERLMLSNEEGDPCAADRRLPISSFARPGMAV
jgi:hypothetical protein